MANRPEPVVGDHRQKLRATLKAAFESEIAARVSGGTNRPAKATAVAADCRGLMEADKEPVRLAALTMCAAKTAFPLIDVQAIQAGGMDFRSRAADTTVPLLREIADVESVTVKLPNDPLVSNPYREPRLDDDWVDKRKGKTKVMGRHLVNIAEFLQANPSQAGDVLAELVADVLDRWGTQKVAYAIPGRVSHALAMEALHKFLANVAGGTHLEWVSVALLRFLGEKWGQWDKVVGHESNDAAPYDAECFLGGTLVALGESKDQEVTVGHIRQMSDEMRSRGVQRGFVFTRDQHIAPNRGDIEEFVRRRHGFGERITVIDVLAAADAWLALGDEADVDLPRFLRLVGEELDEWSGLASRREWAQILANLG
jgi:hypothetical protein